MTQVIFRELSTTPSEGELPEGVTAEVKGDELWVTVPKDADWADYILDSDEDGDIIVRGEGYGNARRVGDGNGDAVRLGNGFGHAIRGGNGHGHARRYGRGDGNAHRGGDGDGDARRDGGDGHARRYGNGEGNAYINGVLQKGSSTVEESNEPEDLVNRPSHYTQGEIECIDAMRSALTEEEFRGGCKMQTLQYIWREGDKGGDEDIGKSIWWLIRVLEQNKTKAEVVEMVLRALRLDEGGMTKAEVIGMVDRIMGGG